jgi:hypothetical protein
MLRRAAHIAMKRPAQQPAFFFGHSAAQRFIPRSPNKAGGTGNMPEHQAIPFVDGVGNAETREETFDE